MRDVECTLTSDEVRRLKDVKNALGSLIDAAQSGRKRSLIKRGLELELHIFETILTKMK